MGFDHVDSRTRSVRTVEPFYDALMPRLGFTIKKYCRVDGDEWAFVEASGAYNAVEYHEPPTGGMRGGFFGVIEDPEHQATITRIAFGVPSGYVLAELAAELLAMGARVIEPSEDPGYPAIFFEDPLGAKLEILAPRAAGDL